MIRTRNCLVGVHVVIAVGATALLARGEGPANTPIPAEVVRSRVAKIEALRPDWERVMKARGIPGLAIVVVHGDEVVFSETLGVRDPVKDLPVTKDTRFYIASCTKSYIAMGIMALVEDGKVDLDAPVKKYLPRFELADKEATESLTVRDLLSHAKGLNSGPAVFLDAYTGEITEDRYYYWLRQAKPTGKYEYTNVHYTLAGRIAEAVTGQSWKDFLQARIFEPSGMYRTTAYASKMYGSEDVAIPCEHNGTRVEPCQLRKTDRVMHAAGGLGTSANDLGRWLRLNLSGGVIDGRRIVSQKSIDAMQRLQAEGSMPPRMPKRERNGYGLGWFVGSYQGEKMLDHGGGYAGTAASISLMPERKLGVAVVGNGSSSLIEIVAHSIYDELLALEPNGKLPGLEAACKRQHKRMREWNEMVARRPVNAKRLTLAPERYVGSYYNEHWGTAVVTEEGGVLSLRIGDLPLRLKAGAKDAMEIYMMPGSAEPGRFELGDQQNVTAFVYDEEDHGEVRFERR